MSKVLDAVIAANIVLDLIESLDRQGIKITPADLDRLIEERQAEKDDLNKQLGV